MLNIDFKMLQNEVKLDDVLSLLGHNPRKVENRLRWICVRCSTGPDDNVCAYDFGTRKWYCHRCKCGGDVIDLYAHAKGMRAMQAAHEIVEKLGIAPERVEWTEARIRRELRKGVKKVEVQGKDEVE